MNLDTNKMMGGQGGKYQKQQMVPNTGIGSYNPVGGPNLA